MSKTWFSATNGAIDTVMCRRWMRMTVDAKNAMVMTPTIAISGKSKRKAMATPIKPAMEMLSIMLGKIHANSLGRYSAHEYVIAQETTRIGIMRSRIHAVV